ncbi:EmrB/QacA subfamily drug resistance transporter [Streptosporangium becharense]|uniref:EmrB/QacA subfamily drug resistance transporter n=1 Tax=Streptosporangium becharense TaxID=1816182 RepID=A0A7W9MED3_9ACTN|nr:MFS transporter [Streptosporangium becharense]MBB2913594.1 EmrB/QacA subfamily drug resistance transporter [Streptosporangium becharense]MBB5817675.1 EmrB/QacA subfamily drug resistance transporter [Streptosporangium becharense]
MPLTSTPTPAVRTPWLLTVVLVGQFMAVLDVSIVNVAAPVIRSDLDASGSDLQMVVSGYTVVYAMLLVTGARLGGRHGGRTLFLYGLAGFTAASLACGLAASAGQLIAFRLLQGAGAALMVPQVLSMIQTNFEGAARSRALGRYAAVLSVAAVTGQVLGGVLVSADLFGAAWRPVFLVNVPIGLGLFALGARALPAGGPVRHRPVDLPGLVTLSLAVGLLVVPLVLGHERGWPLWGWVAMAASAGLAVVFVLVERRAAAPLVPARVLRAPGAVHAAAVVFGAMATYGGFLFALALHLQGVLGESPPAAGLAFVPAAAGFAAAGIGWRRVPGHPHRFMIIFSCVVAALGYLMLGAALGGGHDRPLLAAALAVMGAGLGGAFSPALAMGLARTAPEDAADASGLFAMVNQLGHVVGVAVFGSLYLGTGSITGTGTALAVTVAAAGVCALPLLRHR